MITISDLYTYPIKSTSPILIQNSHVGKCGLQYDREWAIFDSQNRVLTAREYPQLLDINCQFKDNQLSVNYKGSRISELSLGKEQKESISLHVHSYKAYGIETSKALNDWFSNFLNISCRLLRTDHNHERPVLSRHGGKPGDQVGFADQSALLILSRPSLEDLNSRLETKIGIDRFRPNIVVEGCAPYAEDNWKIIQIGNCKFRIIHHCERCVLTTIDPISKQKSNKGEPLVTLSKYRKVEGGGVIFGVRAVPLSTGFIAKGDQIEVID